MTARSQNARDVARNVLARVEQGGAWATLALDGELARSGLTPRDRGLATEIVYGVLRHRLRIDRALGAHANLRRTPAPVLLAMRVAAYQMLLMRVPAHAAVDDAVQALRPRGAKLAGFANAVLRKVASQGEPALPPTGEHRVWAEHSLPEWIGRELQVALGGDAVEVEAAAAAMATQAPLWIRANRKRATVADVAAALAEEGATAVAHDSVDGALSVTGVGDPGGSQSFQRGLWTVQDLAAQQVIGFCDVAAASRVLDACAGVGGKATHLAELVGPGIIVDAVDIAPTKIERARDTARRLGVDNVRFTLADLRAPTWTLPSDYPLVVLDAPCTGLGVLRRHPEAKWRLRPDDVAAMAELQRQLLQAVAPHVAKGGVLLYSVCSFSRAEGEDQVSAFVAAHPDFAIEEIATGHRTFRSWPHRGGGDAFFAARLRRATR